MLQNLTFSRASPESLRNSTYRWWSWICSFRNIRAVCQLFTASRGLGVADLLPKWYVSLVQLMWRLPHRWLYRYLWVYWCQPCIEAWLMDCESSSTYRTFEESCEYRRQLICISFSDLDFARFNWPGPTGNSLMFFTGGVITSCNLTVIGHLEIRERRLPSKEAGLQRWFEGQDMFTGDLAIVDITNRCPCGYQVAYVV